MATPPFARFEWMIAWRYLRARRAEGGVSVMTWISLIGITLAVFALVATMAVRSGFRSEFVDTILGANAHMTIYAAARVERHRPDPRTIPDYAAMADRVRQVPGVTRVAPLVKGQVMANLRANNAGVEVFGIAKADLLTIPRIAHPEDERRADIADFDARHRHRLGRRPRTRRRRRRPDPADLAQRRAHRPSAPRPASAPTRSSTSSPPAATTSTAPASTCRSPRRRASSTAKAWPTSSR